MKHILTITLLFLLAAPAVLAQGNGYTLSWWTVDGGGGSSSSGGYGFSGSIGQADAGTLSGGGYTLSGGFWFGQEPTVSPGTERVYLPIVLK